MKKLLLKRKKANMLYQIILQLIIVGLIAALFFASALNKVNSRGVKQQVIEKQMALLIDSAPQNTIFTIKKQHVNGYINNMEIRDSRIFAYVDDQKISKGYAYFSRYSVELKADEQNYYIFIK